jgi:hypothetical protein
MNMNNNRKDVPERTLNTEGPVKPFDADFDFTYEQWGPINTEGWSMSGYYQTDTTMEGEHVLKLNAFLKADAALEETQLHYAAWVLGTKDEKLSTEVFRCWWDPASFTTDEVLSHEHDQNGDGNGVKHAHEHEGEHDHSEEIAP